MDTDIKTAFHVFSFFFWGDLKNIGNTLRHFLGSFN